MAAALLAAACDSGAPAPADDLGRELFVDAYVELRLAAMRSPDGVIPAGERDRVLAELGSSEDGMLAFVDVHGEDLEFMKVLWEEIADRIRDAEIDTPAR